MTASAALERRFVEADQILGLFLNLDLAVAQHAKHALSHDRETREQLVEKQRDHLFDGQETDPVSRQAHEAIDRWRDQDQCLQPGGIGYSFEFEDQAKAAIGNKRKRMGRVDRQRRQHREDLRHESIFEPGVIARSENGRIDDRDAGFVELSAQGQPDNLLIGHQLACPPLDLLELLRGGQPVLAQRLYAGKMLAFEPGHPHHVELVEIVRRDRQETEPFEQRMAQVVSLGENTLVEGEPGELPIDKASFGLEVDRLYLDWIGTGSHFRSPTACSRRILSPGYEPVMLRPSLAGCRLVGPSLMVAAW